MPFARMRNESLVDISPSTEIRLKLMLQALRSALSSISREMAQSVVAKQSMVPMLGWIIPEPFTMAPMRTGTPPISTSVACSFRTVSVVMMASAALAEPSGEWLSFSTAPGSPSSMASIFSRCPMIPVEHTSTSSLERPSAPAPSCCIFCALTSQSSAQALAMPEFAMMARALPSFTVSMSSSTGAAFTTFLVKTPAQVHASSEATTARSFFTGFGRIPQMTPDA